MTNNDDDKYHDNNEDEYNKYDYDDEYPNNKNE